MTKAYNGLNQLTSIEDWNAHTTSFTYDGAGGLATISYPNGVTDTNVYNNAEQLTSMTDVHSGTTIASFTYGRDNNGQASSQATTGMPGSSSISYSYNPLSELSAAGSSSYSYDSAQNLITAPNGDNQKFNADAQLCWQGTGTSSSCTAPTGATSYAYSDPGNRTSMTPSGGTATTYGWNQLTGFTPPSGSATSYTYDDQGLLTTETTGSSTKNFVWDTLASVPEMVGDGTNYYLYGPTTTPIEQIAASGGTTSYLLADDLGSVRAITNSSGTITGAVSYDAWGNTSGTSGSITTPFGFTGAYFDSASGLYYMRARWYDATTGQWMSVDPNLTGTRMPYAYVNNNPVNGEDPNGDIGVSVPIHLSRLIATIATDAGVAGIVLSELPLPSPITTTIELIIRLGAVSATVVGLAFQVCVNEFDNRFGAHAGKFASKFSCYANLSFGVQWVVVPVTYFSVTLEPS